MSRNNKDSGGMGVKPIEASYRGGHGTPVHFDPSIWAMLKDDANRRLVGSLVVVLPSASMFESFKKFLINKKNRDVDRAMYGKLKMEVQANEDDGFMVRVSLPLLTPVLVMPTTDEEGEGEGEGEGYE